MFDTVEWAGNQQEEVIEWLSYDLQQTLSARATLERQWRDQLDQYRASPFQPKRSWPFEGAPLARDTEILTATGWRRIDAIRIGESVLTRRDVDGAMEWHPVEALPQRYADELYHFKSRSMDLMVTEEHVMVAEHQGHPGVVRRIPARDLWGKHGFYLPQHGQWLAGKQVETLWGRPAGDVAELIGWFLAEGSVFRNSGRPSGLALAQSQTAHADQCRRIETILERCGIRWSYGGNSYRLHKSSIPTGLFDLLTGTGLAGTKRIPPICWTWDADTLNRLLTGMVMGDGNTHDTYPTGTTPKVNYYTISKGLADDVQVLALLCGMHARVRSRVRVGSGGTIGERKIEGKHRSYEVTLCASERGKYSRAFHAIVPYHDMAYCVTVKNHAIYARRNGVACWTGNSNRVLPITATDVDQLFASHMQTIHATDYLWTCEAMNERWVDAAKPMQDFLAFLDHSILNMWSVNNRVFLELVKHGTGIWEHGWTHTKTRVMTYDDQGKVQMVDRIVSRPFVDHVPLVDFIIPPYATAHQPDEQGGAPWVAKRVRIRPDRLRLWAKITEVGEPTVDPVKLETVLAYEEAAQTQHQLKIQDLDYTQRTRQGSINFDTDGSSADSTKGLGAAVVVREIELFEVHARCATQRKTDDDVVLWFHLPTRTILRATYLKYHHGYRPFEVARYFPGDGFYGIGVCEQTKMFQDELSDLFNFTHDNVLLTNSRMIVAKAGANIAPGEPIYPWKIWTTDGNVNEDFGIFPMADLYPSLPTLIQFVQNLKERRSGQGDLQLGNLQSLPSRTPATTTQALLAEGKRRPDLTVKSIRYALGRVGLRILQLCQQFIASPDKDAQQYLVLATELLGMPEGQAVTEKLMTPMENAELGLGVAISAVSSTANKDAKTEQLQGLLALQGQLSQQYMQMMQVVTQMPGSPMAKMALDQMEALNELTSRIYEQHDIRNPEALQPDLAEAEAIATTPPPPPQLPAGPQQAPGGGPAPTGGPPGMGGVPGGARGGSPAGGPAGPPGGPR